MNGRQKKKQFKKRYGVNPPKNIPMTQAVACAKKITTAFARLKSAVLDFAVWLRKALLELAEKFKKAAEIILSTEAGKHKHYIALKDYQNKEMEKQRQQEREVKQVESYINIHDHDRR